MTAVLELLDALVRIDSANPSLSDGAPGEAEVATYVADWARAAGLGVEVVERTPGRPSVLVHGGRAVGGRRLLLCGHLDTVGLAGMDAPLTPRVVDDRLYARGAYDMKAGLAAALVACRDAAAAGIAGEVVVAAVADEEHASIGVQEVLAHLAGTTFDAAVVTEPTELAVGTGHRGFVWTEVTVTGVAAHGSRPHLGVDAILKAGPLCPPSPTSTASWPPGRTRSSARATCTARSSRVGPRSRRSPTAASSPWSDARCPGRRSRRWRPTSRRS